MGQQPEAASAARPVPLPINVEQRQYLRVVPSLAAGQDQRDRSGPQVGQGMDLGAQAAAGPAQGMIGRLDGEIVVIPRCPLCAPGPSKWPPGR